MLTAKLILDRLDKDYRLLERREQPSKSFTKGFLELLYIAHAQIASGSPYSMADIRGVAVDIDSQVHTPNYATRGTKANLAFGSPPGSCQSTYSAGGGGSDSLPVDPLQNRLLGEHLGIQVGGGTTAVTPTDRYLETRFGHGIKVADVGNATFESYTTGDDKDKEIYGVIWGAQTFRAQHHHKLYSVKLLVYRERLPGTITVDIYAGRCFEGKTTPFGSVLVTQTFNGDAITETSPGEWVEVTFPSQIELIPGMDYVIVIHCAGDSNNSLHWRYDDTSALYPRGTRIESLNGGTSWSKMTGDGHMFEEIGRSSGELQYSGCELVDLLFTGLSPHDGEFTIKRYFKSNSGESRTVNEVGIYAAGTEYTATYEPGRVFPFLIAHDIVSPGVAVADGQLLRVTYVPQITV